jgi:hypothetical protein
MDTCLALPDLVIGILQSRVSILKSSHFAVNSSFFLAPVKINIGMLQQTNKEIERLELQLAIIRTARINYTNAIKVGIVDYPIYSKHLALQ